MDLSSRITDSPLATMLLRQEAAVESDVVGKSEVENISLESPACI